MIVYPLLPSVRPLTPCKSVRDYLDSVAFNLCFWWDFCIRPIGTTAIQPIGEYKKLFGNYKLFLTFVVHTSHYRI